MIVGVAERPTVLLVDDVANMVVEGVVSMTLGVGVPEGSIVSMPFGVPEGVKILTLVAEVTEGVGCSVCSVHVWEEEGRKGG